MLFLIELWESVRSFIATGGNVLYVVCLRSLIDVDNDDRALLDSYQKFIQK